MAQPTILQFAGELDRAVLPVGAATALEVADLVSYEASAAVLLDAAGEDATFAGYMINQHTANQPEPDRVVVGLRGMLKMSVTSATYDFADGLKYASENTLVADGGANTLAWAAEYAATVTTLKVAIDVIALSKLFGVDA